MKVRILIPMLIVSVGIAAVFLLYLPSRSGAGKYPSGTTRTMDPTVKNTGNSKGMEEPENPSIENSPVEQGKPEPEMKVPQPSQDPKRLDEAKLVKIALTALDGKLAVPANVNAIVKYSGNVATVTWPVVVDPNQPQPPGPEYYARVELDAASGKIRSILGGS